MQQTHRKPAGRNLALTAEETLHYSSGTSRYGGQQTQPDERRLPPGPGKTYSGQSNPNVWLNFLSAIYANLDIDKLRDGYFEAISSIVPASAFGIYLLGATNAYHAWVATPIVPKPPQFRDNGAQCTRESPRMQVVNVQESVSTDQIFCDYAQIYQPLQEFIDVRQLTRFARIPTIGNCGQLLGALSFARMSREPAFGHDDYTIIRVVAHHVSVATDHARIYAEVCRRFTEIRERKTLAEATLKMFASSVMVKEDEPENMPANFQAQERIRLAEPHIVFQTGMEPGQINHRLDQVRLSKQSATGAARLPKQAPATEGCAVHQSIRIPTVQLTARRFLSDLDIESNLQSLTSDLSNREIEVLILLAQGLRNQDIAAALHITLNTVKHHLKNMFQKMQVNSRSELLTRAFPCSAGN